MTKAVILAGGYGTRLKPLTSAMPKSMIPLVNKPVIDYILDYLIGYGLKEIVITTNYLREKTINYLSSRRKDLKIEYPEEPSPLGTAGSLKNAGITERTVVIQGDNITEIDIGKVMKFHRVHEGLVTIALLPVPNPSLYGIAEIESTGTDTGTGTGMITSFKEKPAPAACFSNLANTGLYIIEPEAMERVPDGKAFDFARDLFPMLVQEKEVYGCVVDGFWVDVGSLEGYIEATRWILEKKGGGCADTAEIEDTAIYGNVAIGEYTKVEKSLIHGPAVIGDHTTLLSSKMYNSMILPHGNLDAVTLHNSVICENALIKNEEIRDTIR